MGFFGLCGLCTGSHKLCISFITDTFTSLRRLLREASKQALREGRLGQPTDPGPLSLSVPAHAKCGTPSMRRRSCKQVVLVLVGHAATNLVGIAFLASVAGILSVSQCQRRR